MKRMNLSHCIAVFMMCSASILSGLPFTNLADTSTVCGQGACQAPAASQALQASQGSRQATASSFWGLVSIASALSCMTKKEGQLRHGCVPDSTAGSKSCTSHTWMVPSSSVMYRPVMSPSSSVVSRTDGSLKMNVAVPLEPSFDLAQNSWSAWPCQLVRDSAL